MKNKQMTVTTKISITKNGKIVKHLKPVKTLVENKGFNLVGGLISRVVFPKPIIVDTKGRGFKMTTKINI